MPAADLARAVVPLRARPALRSARFAIASRVQLLRSRRAPASPLADRQLLFVIGQPRTGTNLLLDYVNQLPGVEVAGELLHPNHFKGSQRRPADARRRLDEQLSELDGTVIGCKLMIEQLEACALGIAELRRRYPRARFVLLYRRSMLDQFVSAQIANVTRQWRSTAAPRVDPGAVTVAFDRDLLAHHCAGERRRYRYAARALGHDAAIVCYEQLCDDPIGELNGAVAPLLGTRFDTIGAPTVQKLRQRPLDEVVQDLHTVVPDPTAPALLLEPPF